MEQFPPIFLVALIRKGSKRYPLPPPLLMVVCHDAARCFSWPRMSWLDIAAPKFHVPRIHIHRIGETMETRTKHQLKLAFWGGVGVVILLPAIFAGFE